MHRIYERGHLVDANAISPMRAIRLGEPFGDRFVDAAAAFARWEGDKDADDLALETVLDHLRA